MKPKIAAYLLMGLFSVGSFSVKAQTVANVMPSGGGTYVMTIDGRPYVALARAQADEMTNALQEIAALKKQLASANVIVKECRSVTDAYERLRKDYVALTDRFKVLADDSVKLNERYSEAAGKLVVLNKDYAALVSDYDALAKKYRDIAVRSAPRDPFDLGIGVVHAADTDRVVAMGGMGTRIFNVGLRGWVFGGQGTYGVMVGTSF